MAMLPYAADDRRDGVVGLAYAIRQVAQLLLMCDAHDIGISIDMETTADEIASPRQIAASGEKSRSGRSPHSAASWNTSSTKCPRIFIYDNYPGGIGFSRPLFDMHAPLLERTRELITGCPCDSGCPSCVGPEGNTGPHAKLVASENLDRLLTGEAVPF
jgi:DEAD/DEAH box helicase domain-containing protein